MRSGAVFLALLAVVSVASAATECKGCLGLDELTFDKILSKFEAALVKFDVAYPYGKKHDTYGELSEEISLNKDIIVGTVGIKDYGDHTNQRLGKRFGLKKEEFPYVILFAGNEKEPIPFPKDREFTVDNLKSFVRENSNIYIGLPGCVEEFDKLAARFVKESDTDAILKKAEELTEEYDKQEQHTARTYKYYVKVMKKILEVGKDFVQQESERLTKITDNKISPTKKEELKMKLNVLKAFAFPIKDEL